MHNRYIYLCIQLITLKNTNKKVRKYPQAHLHFPSLEQCTIRGVEVSALAAASVSLLGLSAAARRRCCSALGALGTVERAAFIAAALAWAGVMKVEAACV